MDSHVNSDRVERARLFARINLLLSDEPIAFLTGFADELEHRLTPPQPPPRLRVLLPGVPSSSLPPPSPIRRVAHRTGD